MYVKWTDYFCSFIDSDLAWRIPLFLQCVFGIFLAIGSLAIPESPRYVALIFREPRAKILTMCSWLIDTDRDELGMRVIADLRSNGNMYDSIAQFEFNEIKEKVTQEVCLGHSCLLCTN